MDKNRICTLCSTLGSNVPLEERNGLVFCPHKGCNFKYMAAMEKTHESAMQIIEFTKKNSGKDTKETCQTCKDCVITLDPDPKDDESPIEFLKEVSASRNAPPTSNAVPKSILDSLDCVKYPILPNRDYFCWLNAAVTLLFHSKSLKNYAERFKDDKPKICTLVSTYFRLVSNLNATTRMKPSQSYIQTRLVGMQDTAFSYLEFKQGCKKGAPDSPIFTILNFLEEFKHMPEIFEIEHFWILYCQKCFLGGQHETSVTSKTIISFQSVDVFNPSAPVTSCVCNSCGGPMKRRLQFKRSLPETCIYHFEKGLAHCDFSRYDFLHQGQRYVLKGFIQYTIVKGKTHFITWIRDPARESWLCCNDLRPGYSTYSLQVPNIDSSEIHIMMWERVLDVEDSPEKNTQIGAASASKEMKNSPKLNMLELKTIKSKVQTAEVGKEQMTNIRGITFEKNISKKLLPSETKGDNIVKGQSPNVRTEILEKNAKNNEKDNVLSLENRNRLFQQNVPGSRLFAPPPAISPLSNSPKSRSPSSSSCSQSPKTSRASSAGNSFLKLPSVTSPFANFLSFKQCSSVTEAASKVDNKILLGKERNESLGFRENDSKPQNNNVSAMKSKNEVNSESISEKNGIAKQTRRRIGHFVKKKNSPESKAVIPEQKKDIETKTPTKVSCEKDVVSERKKGRANSKVVKGECNFDSDSPANSEKCQKPVVQQCDSTTVQRLSAEPDLINKLHEGHSEHLPETSDTNFPDNSESSQQSISESAEISGNVSTRKLRNAKTRKGKSAGKKHSPKTSPNKTNRQRANRRSRIVPQVVTDKVVTPDGDESTRTPLKDFPACKAIQKISTPVTKSISQKMVEGECETVSDLRNAKTQEHVDILFQNSEAFSGRQNPIDRLRQKWSNSNTSVSPQKESLSDTQVTKSFDNGNELFIADLKRSKSERILAQKSNNKPLGNTTLISNNAETCSTEPDANKTLSNLDSSLKQNTPTKQSFKNNRVNGQDGTSLDDSLVSQEAFALDQKSTFEKEVPASDSLAASSQFTSRKQGLVQQSSLPPVSKKRHRKLSYSSRVESESPDENTPKQKCEDTSQLPHSSKQDIEQKHLQYTGNSVTPLSTILGETSHSSQLVKKRNEDDFAEDRPLQDMDCTSTCPSLSEQKKNASIEEADMDESSMERRPTVMYLRKFETHGNDIFEPESMELDNRANVTKDKPENPLAKDISPNDSVKEAVSTVDNSSLLQGCISPAPPVLKVPEDARTENDEQSGSTSSNRETKLNNSNDIVEKDHPLGDLTERANQSNTSQESSGRSLRRNTRKDYRSDSSITLQTNTEISGATTLSGEVNLSPPVIKRRGRRKGYSPINKTKDAHVSDESPPKKAKQECVQSEKFENVLVAPLSLFLYNSAKKYEKPTLKMDQQESDKNTNPRSFEQEEEEVLESKVKESEMGPPKFLVSMNTDSCTLNVANNNAISARRNVSGSNSISNTLLVSDAALTVDKKLYHPQRKSFSKVLQKAATEDSIKSSEVLDSTAPSNTGETVPLTKYPPSVTDGSEELAGIVKAVSKFSSPDALEIQQKSGGKHPAAQPEPVPDTKDINSVSQPTSGTEQKKRRGRPRKSSCINLNASTSKSVEFSSTSNEPVVRGSNKRLKRQASESSQATLKTPRKPKVLDRQITPLLKNPNDSKVDEKVCTNQNNAESSTKVLRIQELTAPEISNVTCIDRKVAPLGPNIKSVVPSLINVDGPFKNYKVFLVTPRPQSGDVKPALTKHTKSEPFHLSNVPVRNTVTDETFKTLATIASQKIVCKNSPEVIQHPPLAISSVGSTESFPKGSETVDSSLEIEVIADKSTFPLKTNFSSKQTNQERKEEVLMTLCSDNDVPLEEANFESLPQSRSAIDVSKKNQRSGNQINVTTVADDKGFQISGNKDCHIPLQTSSAEIVMAEGLSSKRRRCISTLAINDQSTSSKNVERKSPQETSPSLSLALNQLSSSNIKKIHHVVNERKKLVLGTNMHALSPSVSNSVVEPAQCPSSQTISDSTQQWTETPSDDVAGAINDFVHAKPIADFKIGGKKEFLDQFSSFVASPDDQFIQQQIGYGKVIVLQRPSSSQVNNTVANMTPIAQSTENRIVPNGSNINPNERKETLRNVNPADKEQLSCDLTTEIPSGLNSRKEGTAEIEKPSNSHADESTEQSAEFRVKQTVRVPVKSLDVFANSKKTAQESQTKEVEKKKVFATLPQNVVPNFQLRKNTSDISNKRMQYLPTSIPDFLKEVSQNSQSTRKSNAEAEIQSPTQRSAVTAPKLASCSKESLQISSEVPKLVTPTQKPLSQKFSPIKSSTCNLNVGACSVAVQDVEKSTVQIGKVIHMPDLGVIEGSNVDRTLSLSRINLQLHHTDESVENKSKNIEKSPRSKTNCRRSSRTTAGCPPQRFNNMSDSDECISEVDEPVSRKAPKHLKVRAASIKSTCVIKSFVLPTKKGPQCQMSSGSANRVVESPAVNSVISYSKGNSSQPKPPSDVMVPMPKLSIQEQNSHFHEIVKQGYSKRKSCDDETQVLTPEVPKLAHITNEKILKVCNINKSSVVKPKRESFISATRNDYLFPSSNMSLRKQLKKS